jgi:hypothetical protein
LATYKLKLPHTLVKSLVVSNTERKNREGWAYVDALPDKGVCYPSPSAPLPIALHYCGRYAMGPDFFFSKYRVKKNFLTCETPLMAVPPSDIDTRYDYMIPPPNPAGKPNNKPEKKIFNKHQVKRETFMMCGLISAVNEAATYYKQQNCGSDANFEKTYTVRKDPSKYFKTSRV